MCRLRDKSAQESFQFRPESLVELATPTLAPFFGRDETGSRQFFEVMRNGGRREVELLAASAEDPRGPFLFWCAGAHFTNHGQHFQPLLARESLEDPGGLGWFHGSIVIEVSNFVKGLKAQKNILVRPAAPERRAPTQRDELA